MSDISLSKAVRSNLLSLQNTATMMAKTQERLATGNKVNSALDNPTNYFTASALNSRAGDINQLLDGMANGIQTLQAADNGLKAITKTLESMQSTLRQARQDKSFETQSFTLGANLDDGDILSFAGGAIDGASVDIALGTAATTASPADPGSPGSATTHVAEDDYAAPSSTQTFEINGQEVSLTDSETTLAAAVTKINGELGANHAVEAYADGDKLALRNKAVGADAIEVTGSGAAVFGTADVTLGEAAVAATPEVPAQPAAAKSVEDLVQEINTHVDLKGKIRASNDNGKLRIENLSTTKLTMTGVDSNGAIDGASTVPTEIGGNAVRTDLHNQFRELRDQLDKLADDASFNGINLLRGDNLQITFNETSTSELNIRSKDEQGISSEILGLETDLQASDLDSDANIDKLIAGVKTAINTVRSQSSAFGSSLSVVQNRQDFSKNMINTLQTGAANLTLADMNEEAANLLALQTRQSLSSSALSMASQADQSVLQLLR